MSLDAVAGGALSGLEVSLFERRHGVRAAVGLGPVGRVGSEQEWACQQEDADHDASFSSGSVACSNPFRFISPHDFDPSMKRIMPRHR